MSEDWKVFEDVEEFKEYFCDWIDYSIDEGLKEDSKILVMRRDGSIFFNFRDIVLRPVSYTHLTLPTNREV